MCAVRIVNIMETNRTSVLAERTGLNFSLKTKPTTKINNTNTVVQKG